MRPIRIAIALLLVVLASFAAAQQASTGTSAISEKQNAATPPPGPILGGMGTTNYIPIWASSSFLENSVIYQGSGGLVGIGTTTPLATLDVNGSINLPATNYSGYKIGYSTVLSVGTGADRNLFLGITSGEAAGTDNLYAGYYAGGSGIEGSGNTFIGSEAGYTNCCGAYDTYIGASAGYSSVSDWPKNNTFVGAYAGLANTQGYGNNFYGAFAGSYNTTGNYDLYIATEGPQSGTESNTIRIGTEGTQLAAYIAGIDTSTLPSGVPVYISNGQLGVQTSSLRFKDHVQDMGDSSDALMKLRPVTFVYKPEYASGESRLQYGLIAEEVAKVYPELVAYDKHGEPYSVRYQYLSTMLLNEVQKQYRRAEQQAEIVASQQAEIKAQQQEIDNLRQQLQLQNTTLQDRLSRLEGMLGARVDTAVLSTNVQ